MRELEEAMAFHMIARKFRVHQQLSNLTEEDKLLYPYMIRKLEYYRDSLVSQGVRGLKLHSNFKFEDDINSQVQGSDPTNP